MASLSPTEVSHHISAHSGKTKVEKFREDPGGKIEGRPRGKIRVEMGIARGLLRDLHTAPSNAIPTDAAGRDLEDVTFQDLLQANVV